MISKQEIVAKKKFNKNKKEKNTMKVVEQDNIIGKWNVRYMKKKEVKQVFTQ